MNKTMKTNAANNTGIAVSRSVWAEGWRDLLVSPSADGPGFVRIHCRDGDRKHWGDLDLTVPAFMARQLAAAILACADEQESA